MSDILSELLGRKGPGGDGDGVPRVQPVPRKWWAVTIAGQTVITRVWHPGDASRCRLCPKETCNVTLDVTCVVLAPKPIPPKEAGLYRRPDAPGRERR